jgi:hypothetical protein
MKREKKYQNKKYIEKMKREKKKQKKNWRCMRRAKTSPTNCGWLFFFRFYGIGGYYWK